MNLLINTVEPLKEEVKLISPEIIKSFAEFLAKAGVKPETIKTVCGIVQTDYFLCGTIVVTSLMVAAIAFFIARKKSHNADYICLTARRRKMKRFDTFNHSTTKGGLF